MALNGGIGIRVIVLLAISVISVFISANMISAEVQNVQSKIGVIQIDIPYMVESKGTDNLISFVKQGTTKPIVTVVLDESAYYKSLNDYAASFVGADKGFESMTTDDGKTMLFNAYFEGNDANGDPNYTFRGCIDYSVEKGKFVLVHGSNKARYQGGVIATFTRDEFLAICRSFSIK